MNLNPLSVSSAKAASGETQPLTLREGQMIHGKVQQLFPGQMAQVQVGNQQLYAKLEVPMQAGDTYYFKVNGTEPEVQLQVIAGPMRGAEGQGTQLSQLMDSLQLPKTAEMKELLAAVIKQKIPMTRENILDAANLLKNVTPEMKAQALQIIAKMANARLPFTPAVFQSMLQAETGSITGQMTTLQNAIQNEPKLPPAMQDQLLSTLQKLSSPAGQSVGRELLGQALTQLLDPQAGKAERFAALQLLKSAGILPARASLANLPQVFAQLLTDQSAPTANQQTQSQPQTPAQSQNQQAAPQQSALPQQPLAETTAARTAAQPVETGHTGAARTEGQTAALKAIQTLISQLGRTPASDTQEIRTIIQNITQQLPSLAEHTKPAVQPQLDQFSRQLPTEETKTAFIEQLSRTLIEQTSRQAASQIPGTQPAQAKEAQQALLSLLTPQNQENQALQTLLQAADRSGSAQVKQLVQLAEAQLAQTMNGPVMREAMQSVFQTLGMNYEALLNGKEPDAAQLANTLKPQLLALLQEPSITPVLREAAETMVLRMNGSIMQPPADTGSQQQLIMQLPIEMFGKKIDATLQWNGRMKENGQIDPAFARILFYLDLESLSTTLVDMHVQNKVVSLTVFNEMDSLRNTGLAFQPLLKEGLESAGYKLSGVSFKPFNAPEKPAARQAGPLQADEGGVDFRI